MYKNATINNSPKKRADAEVIAELAAAKERFFAETGEKDCAICGMFFKPKRSSQKYCPDCSDRSQKKRQWMGYGINRSIQEYGTGAGKKAFACTCRVCGKEFTRFGESDIYCSYACRAKYLRENAKCPECGRNLAALGIEPKRNALGGFQFCSDECHEKHKWRVAREAGNIAICENCGKEIIGRDRRFCDLNCQKEYKKKSSEGQNKHICLHCGKTFVRYGRAKFCSVECFEATNHAIRHGGSGLNEYEKAERAKFLRQNPEKANLEKAEPEKAKPKRKKQTAKQKAKREAYIAQNGLCSICRTSYGKCERMKSDFQINPIGAVFSGNIVVECPKFN